MGRSLIGIVPTLFVAALSAQANRNLLVIVADDLGPELLGCYQLDPNPPATPTIDQLASGGIRFDRVYANPVCVPSRIALQTGRYASRSGVLWVQNGQPGLRDEEVLLPEVLAPTGRPRAMIGKWHMGTRHGAATPNVQGWPHFVGGLNGSLDDHYVWPKVRNGVTTQRAAYVTTDEVDEALAWIQAQQQPWLLLLTCHAPHTPLQAPPAGLHRQQLSGLDPAVTPMPFLRAMVEALDSELGRLLQGLGPARANTNIVFVGDNGTPGQFARPSVPPDRAKGTLYEAGLQVPLLLSGPAVVQAGRVHSGLVSIVDLFPTMLELCGVDPVAATAGRPIDGYSLLPIVRNHAQSVRTSVFAEVLDTGFGNGYMFMTSGVKLIRYTDSAYLAPHERMYDLRVDPFETNDLIAAGLTPMARQVRDYLADQLADLRPEGHVLQYGVGCAGPNGAVRVRSYVPPRIGTTFPVRTVRAGANGAPFMAMLTAGWQSLGQPIDLGGFGMPGCSWWIQSPQTLLFGPDQLSVDMRIPSQPALVDVKFHLQSIAFEAGANAVGLISSPAFQVAIGQ